MQNTGKTPVKNNTENSSFIQYIVPQCALFYSESALYVINSITIANSLTTPQKTT